MKNRTKRIVTTLTTLGLSTSLLAACGLGQNPTTLAESLSAQADAGILPGSKGGIRPSSKGTRLELAQLEVEVRLPLADGFEIAQARTDAAEWSAQVDGAAPGKLRQIRSRRLADAQSLVFVLEASRPLAEAEVHELLFFTPDGVLQAAALVPELPAQSRLREALSSESLASWLVARELMQDEEIQSLPPESLTTIGAEAETAQLAQDLAALYRQSHGKADPRKSDKTRLKAKSAAGKLADKVKKQKAQKAQKHR